MSDPRFERPTPVSGEDLRKIERLIHRSLPHDFCRFIETFGGAFVGGAVDGSPDLPLLHFLGANPECGILSTIRTHSDLAAIGALPFARCELGNLYVLDAENAVHYIDYYGGKTAARKVSASFRDFVDRIVVDFDE